MNNFLIMRHSVSHIILNLLYLIFHKNQTPLQSELLPLLEAGASWEVSAFASQIYLPSSSGSPCPIFLFPNISTFLFQHLLYSVPHCNLYQFQFHSTHIYSFFLITSVPL